MAPQPYVYLINGANRGIGLGLITALAARPDVTIVAGIRNIANKDSVEHLNDKAAPGTKVVAVQLRASDTDDAAALPATLASHGIDHVDTVIANAAISKWYGTVLESPLDEYREHFEVNTIGMVVLFQATWPLLERARQPKFVFVSSAAGSIGAGFPARAPPYGASKAAGNFITVKIHAEHPQLTAFAISPGWVQTDMGQYGAQQAGLESAPETLEGIVPLFLAVVDGATREKDGGKFKDFREPSGWPW